MLGHCLGLLPCITLSCIQYYVVLMCHPQMFWELCLPLCVSCQGKTLDGMP